MFEKFIWIKQRHVFRLIIDVVLQLKLRTDPSCVYRVLQNLLNSVTSENDYLDFFHLKACMALGAQFSVYLYVDHIITDLLNKIALQTAEIF